MTKKTNFSNKIFHTEFVVYFVFSPNVMILNKINRLPAFIYLISAKNMMRRNVLHFSRFKTNMISTTSPNQLSFDLRCLKRTTSTTINFCTYNSQLKMKSTLFPSILYISRKPFHATNVLSYSIPVQEKLDAAFDGEYYYQKAMEAVKNKERQDIEEETRQAQEQFEAMKRANEKKEMRERQKKEKNRNTKPFGSQNTNSESNRAAGVAVIKTISKQARQKKKEKEIGLVNGYSIDTTQITKTKKKDTNESRPMNWEEEEQKWLKKAAFDFNHPKALVRLGNQFLVSAKNQLHSENDLSSDSFLKSLCNMDERINISFLENQMNENNLNAAHNAAYLYKAAGQQNSKEGWFNLGHLLWTGFPELDNNTKMNKNDGSTIISRNNPNVINESQIITSSITASLEAFEKAIQLGDADAMYFVGVQFLLLPEETLTGYNSIISVVPKSTKNNSFPPHSSKLNPQKRKGLQLIEKAAQDYDHGGAMYYLALLHLNGDPELYIPGCTSQQFKNLLDSAADIGQNPDAIYLRAHSLYHGNIFEYYPKDSKKALEGFEHAANLGNSDGAVSAGAMWYEKGDSIKAFDWYQKAAEMGNKEGWRNLVRCYALGEGVIESKSTAEHIAKLMLTDDDKE